MLLSTQLVRSLTICPMSSKSIIPRLFFPKLLPVSTTRFPVYSHTLVLPLPTLWKVILALSLLTNFKWSHRSSWLWFKMVSPLSKRTQLLLSHQLLSKQRKPLFLSLRKLSTFLSDNFSSLSARSTSNSEVRSLRPSLSSVLVSVKLLLLSKLISLCRLCLRFRPSSLTTRMLRESTYWAHGSVSAS